MEVSFRGVFDVVMIDCVASSSDKNCFYCNSFLSECDSSDLNLRKNWLLKSGAYIVIKNGSKIEC